MKNLILIMPSLMNNYFNCIAEKNFIEFKILFYTSALYFFVEREDIEVIKLLLINKKLIVNIIDPGSILN